MNHPARPTYLEVFRVFLRLGLTSFGGPVAHLGYFHEEFVVRRRWLDTRAYADLVALCQFLPGPTSSQVGMSVGLLRAGLPGLFAAFLGFTLPSALLMIGFAYGVVLLGDLKDAGWLRGLELAAVAVVVQAVWTMATRLCPDRQRITLALMTAIGVLAWTSAAAQIVVISLGALAGRFLLRDSVEPPVAVEATGHFERPIQRGLATGGLAAFFGLLVIMPSISAVAPGMPALGVFNGFYRAGSLVFGGGHVVLPLLQSETVGKGLVTSDQFLAGYGAAQALPGPLFTFAGYLGALMHSPMPNGWEGAFICLVAIFLPSSLLLIGVMPFWEILRRRQDTQAVLRGVNAAVVGVLLAALYRPVWTSAVKGPQDFMVVLLAFGLLMFWRCPPWIVVVLAGIGVPCLEHWTISR